MPHFARDHHRRIPSIAACLGLLAAMLGMAALAPSARAAGPSHKMGYGTDRQLGGFGTGQGKFDYLNDFTFGPKGEIYALDGARYSRKTKKMVGNLLVQIFDHDGKFLRQFPIVESPRQPAKGDPTPNMPELTNNPQRIAVDSEGRVYLTQPWAEAVQVYNSQGDLRNTVPLPYAKAITLYKPADKPGRELIAVLPSGKRALPRTKGWTPVGGDKIVLLWPGGHRVARVVHLDHTVHNALDLAADTQGNFYIQAHENQIYKFDAQGKMLKTIGSGTTHRTSDGSELLATVAVDAKGNIYSVTFGNPGYVTRFNAELTTLTQNKAWFKWANTWSYSRNYIPMAVDAEGRLWVAATSRNTPKDHWYTRNHFEPAIMRVKENYFDPKLRGVRQQSTWSLGLSPAIEAALPYSISYNMDPVESKLAIVAANRMIDQVHVSYVVYDMWKHEVGKQAFTLALENGKAASHDLSFTPPRYGWYTMELTLSHGDQRLMTLGKHFGVTPRYDGMVALKAGESNGGTGDVARHMFCGMPLVRFGSPSLRNFDHRLDALAKKVRQAQKYGAIPLVQFTYKKQCTPEIVRKVVSRLKDDVKYWALVNEPNYSMSVKDYVALVKQISPLIHEIDPQAKVMGPQFVDLNLGWLKTFYKLGGGKYIDILSVHDYEGHETIDPVHWRWKFAQIRKIMAAHGGADKPIWQTERAITGVRGDNFMGGTQAVRVMLHQNLLETLGVPNKYNNLFYLNEHGFSKVPSYLWSSAGPHPAALTMRTRYAMTAQQRYAGALDFGTVGNKLFMGLRFTGDNPKQGNIILLSNLGTRPKQLTLNITGPNSPVIVVDSFGNEKTIPVKAGRVAPVVAQLPIYLKLAPGQKITAPKIDLGKDLALHASFRYSAKATQIAHLNDGIWQTINVGNPRGGTNGKALFMGEIPEFPQTLEIALPQRQAVGSVLIAGLHADNHFCALLDYDLEARVNGTWKTIERVRVPVPPSEPVRTPDSVDNTWYLDNNRFFNSFTPVTTDRLRLVVHRTTYGLAPDKIAKTWGAIIPPKLMLREVEIYGPSPDELPIKPGPSAYPAPTTAGQATSAPSSGGR